jgi:hypothetical protein
MGRIWARFFAGRVPADRFGTLKALGTSHVTTLAIAPIVWSVISTKIGKRPVYLASTALLFVRVMVSWEGTLVVCVTVALTLIMSSFTAKDYRILMRFRIIQGVRQAPLEVSSVRLVCVGWEYLGWASHRTRLLTTYRLRSSWLDRVSQPCISHTSGPYLSFLFGSSRLTITYFISKGGPSRSGTFAC